MRIHAIFLLLLLAGSFTSAEETVISLKSADGRVADFSGILMVTENGLLVSRGANPDPLLLRWELLDLSDLAEKFPEIPEMRATGGLFPRGIYAPQNATQHPRAAMYRILHSPREVDPPDFNDFFSRIPPERSDPHDPRVGLNHLNAVHFHLHFPKSQRRYEHLVKRFFPQENLSFQSDYGAEINTDPADLKAPQVEVIKRDKESPWQLPPYHALHVLTAEQMRQDPERSGPHVDVEFTQWAAEYLRRIDLFTSLMLEIAPLIDAAESDEKRELQRFRESLSLQRWIGAEVRKTANELHRFLNRYTLP